MSVVTGGAGGGERGSTRLPPGVGLVAAAPVAGSPRLFLPTAGPAPHGDRVEREGAGCRCAGTHVHGARLLALARRYR